MKVFLINSNDAFGKRMQASIREALSDVPVQVITVDSLLKDSEGGSVWASLVSDAIESSDLVIADVSARNPNVLYELGFAHALRKPTILLVNSQSHQHMPSDLAHMFYLSYDPEDLSTLGSYVRHNVVGRAGRTVKMRG